MIASDSQLILIWQGFASNPASSGVIFETLYNSWRYDEVVRKNMAKNPSTPGTMLEALFQEFGHESSIRVSLASNLSSSSNLLNLLFNLHGDEGSILVNLAGNASCPAELLEKIAHQILSSTKYTTRMKYHWKPIESHTQNIVLFLPSDALDQERLRLLDELGEIDEQVENAKYGKQFKLMTKALAQPIKISKALQDLKPTIVHFAGHGSEDGQLIAVDEVGNSLPLSLENLAGMIQTIEKPLDWPSEEPIVKCILLNACYTEQSAAKLLEYVQYVIAYKEAYYDNYAISFAKGFYQALSNAGSDIYQAFRAGLAQIPDREAQKNLVLLER